MPDMIRDGKGNGSLAEVDSQNRLMTYSIVEDEATYVNRIFGETYSGFWTSTGITASTAGNWVIYLKNIHATKHLVVERLKHRCEDDSGSMSFWLNVDGVPAGSLTTLTPSNRNAGSNNSANCTYYASAEITGLSGGRKVGSTYGVATADSFNFQAPCSGWILPPNTTLGVKADNNTAKHFGGLSFYFRDV